MNKSQCYRKLLWKTVHEQGINFPEPRPELLFNHTYNIHTKFNRAWVEK